MIVVCEKTTKKIESSSNMHKPYQCIDANHDVVSKAAKLFFSRNQWPDDLDMEGKYGFDNEHNFNPTEFRCAIEAYFCRCDR